MTEEKKPTLAGGITIQRTSERTSTDFKRLTMMLVSAAGVGKTTLAATAPGNKFYMMFDPGGDDSLPNRDDLTIANMSSLGEAMAEQLIAPDPFGIGKHLQDDTYDTVIVDSLSAVSDLALDRGIATSKGATIARPSLQGFGIRSAYTLTFIKRMLALTKRYNKHIIFIAHEDVPTLSDAGVVLSISIMLGGKLPQIAPKDISEVWWLYDQTKKKSIGIRPVRNRTPAKTRMFKTTGSPEFVWKFNPDTWQGEGIADWYKAWQENNYQKIDIPKGD